MNNEKILHLFQYFTPTLYVLMYKHDHSLMHGLLFSHRADFIHCFTYLLSCFICVCIPICVCVRAAINVH